MDNRDPEIPLEPISPSHFKRTDNEKPNESNVVVVNESTPLISSETGTLPPLAKPENGLEDIDGPPMITITQPEGSIEKFLDEECDDDRDPEISDRAGGFPYAPGFGGGISSPAPGSPESIPDVNMYQQKKTVAQGMMDLALFSANANQLRYVLDSSNHAYYYSGIVLIAFSLILQVGVGVGLLWNTRYDVKDEKEICIANKVNNFTIVGIFLITVLNVFISAFGTTAG